MELHAQNQLNTYFSFWDRKVLIASLGMPEHAWPHSCKITSSTCSFNGPAICTCMQKIDFIPLAVFEISKFKNRTIWLANSIFAFNSRTRFFLDIRFYQNHKGHYGAWFKPKKSTYQWTIFLCKIQRTLFWGVFWGIVQNFFSPKIRLRQFFYPEGTLTSWEVSDNS